MHADAPRSDSTSPLAGAGVIGPSPALASTITRTITTRTISPVRPVVFA